MREQILPFHTSRERFDNLRILLDVTNDLNIKLFLKFTEQLLVYLKDTHWYCFDLSNGRMRETVEMLQLLKFYYSYVMKFYEEN